MSTIIPLEDNSAYNERMFGHAASELSAARVQGAGDCPKKVMRTLQHVFGECAGGLKKSGWKEFRNLVWKPVCDGFKNGGDFKAALSHLKYDAP